MNPTTPNISYKEIFTITILLALATHNFFFETYREMIFDINPHDHYEHFAHLLIGNAELGSMPPTTHAFRFLAVFLVIPFYYIVPVFSFSGAQPPEFSVEQIRMFIAFSLVTYLSALVTCVTTYMIVRKHFSASRAASLFVLLMMYIMLHHIGSGLYGVDMIGAMVLTLAIYFMGNQLIFSLLVIIGVFINERIAMLFFMIMWMRWLIYHPRKIDMHIIAPTIAMILYLSVYTIVPQYISFSAGNEPHGNVANFLHQFMETFALNFTTKGIVLNVIPILLLIGIATLAYKAADIIETGIYFKKSDVIALLGLWVVIHLVNVDYNVGRISMFTLPLYLPLAALMLYHFATKEDRLQG